MFTSFDNIDNIDNLEYSDHDDMTSVKLARPPITAIFILREPPANYMFLGQFGATDSEPRIILAEFGLYHGEI